MQNFVYVKESTEVTMNDATERDLLTLSLPGSQFNPQNWVVLASIDLGNGPGTSATFTGSTKCNVQVGSTIISEFSGRFLGGTIGVIPDNARHHPLTMFYLKDYAGGTGASTAGAYKFVGKNQSAVPGTNLARFRNQTFLAIRIPKGIKSDVHYYEMQSSVSANEDTYVTAISLSGTTQIFGQTTFTPKKGRYLIISTAQLDFTTNVGDKADLWLDVYQHENATTENGATNLLKDTFALEHVTGTGIGHFTLFGDAAAFTIKYPVTLMGVVDLDSVPCTIAWNGDSDGTTADVTSVRTIAIPLDGNFVYSAAQNFTPISASTVYASSASYTNSIDSTSIGIAGKNTFVIANDILYSYPSLNTIIARGNATTFGDFITEAAASEINTSESTQLAGIHMFTGVDTCKLQYTILNDLAPAGAPDNQVWSKNAFLLALTDMQSGQDTNINFDFSLSQDINGIEKRNYIDQPTAKALEDVAEECSPTYTNIVPIIRDQISNSCNLASSDTAYLFDGTNYSRDP